MKITMQMEFDSLVEMLGFFGAGASKPVAGTITIDHVTKTPPVEVPLPKEATVPTEPQATEPKKRGRKAKPEDTPVVPPPVADPVPPAPAAPAGALVSEEQRDKLRDKLREFMTKHGLAAAEAILQKYGAKRVMDLKAEHFDAFAKDLEG